MFFSSGQPAFLDEYTEAALRARLSVILIMAYFLLQLDLQTALEGDAIMQRLLIKKVIGNALCSKPLGLPERTQTPTSNSNQTCFIAFHVLCRRNASLSSVSCLSYIFFYFLLRNILSLSLSE